MTWPRRSLESQQCLFARALGVLELAGQDVGPAGELDLLLAQLQQVARAGEELLVVDRTVEKIGSAGFEGAQTEFALLVNRDDDTGISPLSGRARKRQMNSAPSIVGILKSVTIRSAVLLEPGEQLERVAEAMYLHARFNRGGKPRKIFDWSPDCRG